MIADIFIRRPVTAIVISLLLMIVGAISIMISPISQYPDIAPPTVSIRANYTGADATTVEQTVTTLIEEQINGTPGMTYMTSNSTSDGQASITVTFDVGTDVDIATLDVQNRVSIAEPALPEAVRRLGVTTRKASTDALMMVGLTSPQGTYDQNFLGNYVNIYIRDALMRVKGVGDVTSFSQPFSMRIWLDAENMVRLNVSPDEVNNAIREQNLRLPGGVVGARPQFDKATFEYPLILDGDINEAEDFENIIIRAGSDGSIIYLKDIARVELGQFSYATSNRVNGSVASMMMINQMPGGNAVETAEGIYAALEELKKHFPEDVDYIVPYETVSVVKASIAEVIETLIIAVILVTLVVFLFLQTWRATLIPVLAIPVSVVGTFIFFILFDFSINNLTMLAFVLAIGIVVDDAIVVVEAVQHHIDKSKLSAKEATYRAMKEISAPVVAIALILAAVFVPVGFIPGMVGQLYQQFAITIAVSVLISAFVALSLTPALCSLLLVPSRDEEPKGLGKLFFKFNNWFENVTSKYGKGVGWTIRKAPIVIALLIAVYISSGFMFNSKSTGFIPAEDGGSFIVGINLPEGASSERADQLIKNTSEDLRKTFPEIAQVTEIIGLNILNRAFKPNAGTFFVQLKPWGERERSVEEIVGAINAQYANHSEAKFIAVIPPAIPGLGSSIGFNMQLTDLQSGDINEFEDVAWRFIGAANQRPEIGMAYTLFNSRTPNYQIKLDREQAKKMGVPISAVYGTLSNYIGSSYVNDFTKFGRNFRVVTQADTTFRMGIEDLNKLYVKNNQGQSVPMTSLVSYEMVQNPSFINHFNIFRAIEISGSAAEGYSTGDALNALEEVAAQVLPEGYDYEFFGLSLQEKESGNTTLLIFGLSVLFVFLLLAALYESWSVPFSILLSVPLGIFGAILTLTFLPKIDNNVFAQIGLITIIGLAAKNAILIVEFAKERVDAGMNLYDATIEAVQIRLRPIIMTSFAFILGILPLTIATGAGAISRKTIGWTVFGGMMVATLVGIFVVPVLYYLITKFAYGKKKLQELEENYKPEEHGH